MGGVAVVWHQKLVWKVKGMENYGPNVVSFLLILGVQRWYAVGAYVPPNDMPMVHRV